MYVYSLLVGVGFIVIFGSSYFGQALRFTEEPNSIVALRNSQVSLNCSATDDQTRSPPTTIFWRKDGVLVRNSTNVQVLSSGHLVIRHFRGRKSSQNDEGVYQCFASNEEGTIASRKVTIQQAVLSRTFKEWPKNITVLQGETARFACQSKRALPKPTVLWLKDGQTISPGERYAVLSNGVLQIDQVQQSDEGKYHCILSNIAKARTSVSGWLQVKQEPPHFVMKPPANGVAVMGKSVKLICSATGSPMPRITWLKDGRVIPLGNRYIINNNGLNRDLTIVGVSKSDAGVYQCFAENALGSTHSDSRVIVKRSAVNFAPPRDLKAVAISSSKLRVTWKPPFGHPNVVAYGVFYQPSDSNRTIPLSKVSNNTSFILTGLQGYTYYNIYVKPFYNKFGEGSQSQVIKSRTLEGKPTSPPTNVLLTSNTPDSIDVHWIPPPKRYHHGVIINYIIRYSPKDFSVSAKIIQVSSAVNHKAVNGLIKGKTYRFQVAAETSKGIGPFSNEIFYTVSSQFHSVISAPNISITVVNSTVLKVIWQKPAYGGDKVQQYRLSYTKDSIPFESFGPFNLSKHDNEFVITNLSPDTQYVIRLMAWDGSKLGQPSLENAQTAVGVVPIPGIKSSIDAKCQSTGPTTLWISWKKVFSPRRITSFKLWYQVKGNLNHATVKSKVVSTGYLTYLESLIPGKTYDVTIKPLGIDGKVIAKNFGSIIECSTPEAAPSSPPRNIQFKVESETMLDLNWEPPAKPNGRITSYIIAYSTNKDLPDDKWDIKTDTVLSNFFHRFEQLVDSNLQGLKYNTEYYIKIKAGNAQGYGPFSKPIRVLMVLKEDPKSKDTLKVSFKYVSITVVEIKWNYLDNSNGKPVQYRVIYTTNSQLPHSKWFLMPVMVHRHPQTPDRSVSVQLANLSANQTYFVKVQADYGNMFGPWSDQLEIPMKGYPGGGINKNQSTNNSGATSSDSRSSKSKNEKEDFEIKLGIIIGCVISAFCVVVLVLFLIWRCPCRLGRGKTQAPEAKKNGVPNGSANGLPNGYSLSASHQSMVSSRLAHNYEESSGGSSIGSGMCQCRCTCSAGRWPTLSNMQPKPNNQTGNGHIITGNGHIITGNGHLVTPSQTLPKSNPYSVTQENGKVMNGYTLQEPPVPLQLLAVQDNGKVVAGTKPITNPKSISVDV